MMLTQLTALRGVLANGGNVHECQAALIAVTDELKHLLTPPEQMQETDKAEQSKSEDRSEERKGAAPKSKGKVSIRQRIADIKARATHTPQHTKDKQYQPKHSINDLTK